MRNPFEAKFRVTQTQSKEHQAMDLVCDSNYNIVATEDGVVTSSQIVTNKANLTWTYGNYIKYRLADGTYILCAHLSKRLVKKGDAVKKGQVIGIMGNTGNSFGAHLHIEHRAANGSTRLNVYDYLGIENKVGAVVEVKKEEKPEEEKPSGKISVGSKVKIVSGATYTNGVKVPSQYIGKPLTVAQKADGKSLIKELYSWVSDSYLAKANSATVPAEKEMAIGAKVKILSGATYTNGVKVPASVIGGVYTVSQYDSKKALLKEIYSWVERKYLSIL